MIIETIFSTLDSDGKPNFAPMGIEWGEELVTVRPFRNTNTYRNLLASGYGVANLTDDVLAYVRSALYDAVLPHFPSKAIPGAVFEGACSWRELKLVAEIGLGDRAELSCAVAHVGRQRDFLGFCRAGYAVIEAAILATRLDFYDPRLVSEKLEHYAEIVRKTGSENDSQAFRLVREYVQKRGNE